MDEPIPDNFEDWPRLAELPLAESWAEIVAHQDRLYAQRRPARSGPSSRLRKTGEFDYLI